jgi:antitoxin ParD1/3/4
MSTLEIILPDELKSLAEKQVAAGRYASVSDYVTNLIRQDQERVEQDRVEPLLGDRLQAGPSKPMTDEDFDAIRKRLDDRANAGRRA